MFMVLGNRRFVTFLLISSGFYIVYWQIFISAPLFLRRYVDPNANVDRILSRRRPTIICFQILVAYLTQKDAGGARDRARLSLSRRFVDSSGRASRRCSMFGALSSFWRSANHPGLALLRILLAPRAARSARPLHGLRVSADRDRLLCRGRLGGYLLHEFGDVLHRPAQMWWVIAAIGVLTAALMWLYGRIVTPARREGQRFLIHHAAEIFDRVAGERVAAARSAAPPESIRARD